MGRGLWVVTVYYSQLRSTPVRMYWAVLYMSASRVAWYSGLCGGRKIGEVGYWKRSIEIGPRYAPDGWMVLPKHAHRCRLKVDGWMNGGWMDVWMDGGVDALRRWIVRRWVHGWCRDQQ